MLVNLSQKTVVAPSLITSTGILVSKATFISVARIVKLPSFAMSKTFERIDIAVLFVIISWAIAISLSKTSFVKVNFIDAPKKRLFLL